MSPAIREIVHEVAVRRCIAPEVLMSRTRVHRIIHVRQMAMALVRDTLPHWSLMKLKRAFGFDHTTIIHAIKRTNARCMASETAAFDYAELQQVCARNEHVRASRKLAEDIAHRQREADMRESPKAYYGWHVQAYRRHEAQMAEGLAMLERYAGGSRRLVDVGREFKVSPATVSNRVRIARSHQPQGEAYEAA